MGPFEMIVVIVLISCGAGVLTKYLEVGGLSKQSGRDRAQLQAELSAIRREMAELKAWASDLILSFDTRQQQQEARLETLERRALEPGSAALGVAARATQPETDTVEVGTRP
jgi:hypothetical protein